MPGGHLEECGAWEETTQGGKEILPPYISFLVQGQIPRTLPVKFPTNSAVGYTARTLRLGGGGRPRAVKENCLTSRSQGHAATLGSRLV